MNILPRPLRSLAAAFALAVFIILPHAARAQQTLYVDDNGTTIYKIAPDGTQTTFATGLGGVAGPVAVDAAGYVYVGYASGSGYGGGIIRYAPDGTQSTFTGYPTIANVTGLAFDGSGHLFESEYGTDTNDNSTIHKITQGGVVSAFAQVKDAQRGLALDAAGNLYVADFGLNSVTKIAPDGTESTFATGLNGPDGLAFDASGNLYVANRSGITITQVTPAGVQSTFATGLSEPSGLAFDQNGNLLVSNSGGTTIIEITPSGAKSTFATGFTGPTGLAFGAPTAPAITGTPNATASVGAAYSYQIAAVNNPATYAASGLPPGLSLNAATGAISGTPTAGGAYTVSVFATNAYGTGSGILTLAVSPGALQQTLYVTNNGNEVIEVMPGGTQTTFVSGVGGAGPLALDAAENLYVGIDTGSGLDFGQVARFTPSGTQSTFAGGLDPTGLTFDKSGVLYESDYSYDSSNNSIIHKITPDGTVTAFATVPYNQGGEAFDSQGNLYVASTGANTVAKIAPDGMVSTFASGFDEPSGVAVDASDNVYVANNGNGFGLTISKITPAGAVSTYVTGLQTPSGLAFDAYGNLYVSNNATHGGGTITEITPAGAKGTFAVGLTNPSGLVFGALPVPVITSATRASVASGAAFTYQITASNTPTSYNATGLPAGLTLNAASGVISGAVTQAGTYTISLFATNAAGAGTGILTLTVTAPAGTPTPTPTSPGVVLDSPPQGTSVVAGADLPLAASVSDPSIVLAQVQFFLDGTLLATVTTAPFIFDATAPVTPGVHTIETVATDTLGNVTTSSVTFTVAAATAFPPPVSVILTPLYGRSLVAGSTITLSISAAADAATALDHVSLYVNGALVQNFTPGDSSSRSVPAGQPTRRDAALAAAANVFQTDYTLPAADQLMNMVAVAFDKLGQSSVSKIANFHAVATSDQPPLVTLSGVSDGAQVAVNSANAVTVNVSAATTNATASGGKTRRDAASTLALMEYYLNGTKLGEATSPPFTFTFTPPASGKYVADAVATDVSGLASISAPVTVTANAVPTVSLAVSGSVTVPDGAKGVILFTRTGDTSAPLTVAYKAKGAAVAGVEFKALPGSITIPAGALKAKLKVKTLPGLADAGVLKLKIQLLAPTDDSYALGTTATVKLKLDGE